MVGEGFPARCKVGVVVSHTEDIFWISNAICNQSHMIWACQYSLLDDSTRFLTNFWKLGHTVAAVHVGELS